MTDHALAYTAFAFVAAILLVIGFLAAKPRKQDDFDGGFSHENDLRVTRVRSPYVISKGE